MANYYEFPEEFPILCLIHDIAQQQINEKEIKIKSTKPNEIEISKYIKNQLNIIVKPNEIKEIQIYIKAKKNIQHKCKNQFKHDLKDVLDLEIEIIKSNIRKINNIIKF